MNNHSSSKSDKLPRRLMKLGRKAMAVTLSMVLMLSAFSFAAFAEEIGAGEPVAAEQNAAVESAVSEEVAVPEAYAAPQAVYVQGFGGITPMALGIIALELSCEGTTVFLEWDDVIDAVRYTVERAYITGGVTGTYGMISDKDTPNYTDYYVPSLPGQSGAALKYRVTAYAADGGVISQVTSEYFVEPMIYIDLAASQTGIKEVHLSWPAVNDAVIYTIYRSSTPGGPFTELDTTTSLEFTDSTTLPDVSYYYRVSSTDVWNYTNGESDEVAVHTVFPVPVNVVATGTSTSTMKITWDAIPNALGYIVYRADTPNGVYENGRYTFVAEFNDSGLAEDTDYYYKVALLDTLGVGPQSAYGHGKTWLNPPVKVDNLDASALSASEIALSWDAVAKAAIYKIYYGMSENDITTYLAEVPATTFTHGGLTAETTYYYRVAAVNASGTGELSDFAFATTGKDKPDTPLNPWAKTLGATSIQISWDAADRATSYKVYAGTDPLSQPRLVGEVTGTTITDINLTPVTTYYYHVVAVNNAGTSDPSVVVSAKTDKNIPDPPTGLKATALSSNTIRVSWDASDKATNYIVYRATHPNGPFTAVRYTAFLTFDNTGLAADTLYYYKVAAYNSYGTSAEAGPVSAATLLATPLGVTATAVSSSSIQVNWSSVIGATGYRVYRSSTPTGTYGLVGTTFSTGYLNTGLAADTGYYYKVVAFNSRSTSAQSAYAYAKTPPVIVRGVPTIAPRVTVPQQYYMAPSIYLGPKLPVGVAALELYVTTTPTFTMSPSGTWSRCYYGSISQAYYLSGGWAGNGYYQSKYTQYGGAQYYHFKFRYVYTDGTYSTFSPIGAAYPAQGMSGH